MTGVPTKYRIMWDYGSYEGYKFLDEEFDTMNEAIKHAVAMNFSTPFIVVAVYWEPKLIDKSQQYSKVNNMIDPFTNMARYPEYIAWLKMQQQDCTTTYEEWLKTH